MNKLKFAIIGCEHAHIGIFIEEMLALGHTCIGVCESNPNRVVSAVVSKFNLPVVEDEQWLLANADIVGSSAINNEKITIIERCEQHGIPIMVDKPAVTNKRDLERLQAVVGRGKIEIGMLLTERFHPAIYTLKSQIDQGVLGDIVSIGIRKPHRLSASQRPAWFFSREQSGGIVIDLLVHDFDLLRWLTGKEILQAEGYMGKRILPEHPDFYDTASVQVLLDGHITAQLYADWFTPERSWTWGDGRLFVTGTEGFAELRLAGDPLISKDGLMLRTTSSEQLHSIELKQPPTSITGDFLQRLQNRHSLLGVHDILQASQASVAVDETVRLIR